MFDIDTLANAVKSFKGFSPSGLDCRFIKLDEQWGIKVYKYEYKRDIAFARQSKFAELELAPAVGISFNAGHSYCYITEVAEPLVDQSRYSDRDEMWDDIDAMLDNDALCDEMHAVVQAMNSYGFYTEDDHAGNFGRLRNGMLVFIDFAEGGS